MPSLRPYQEKALGHSLERLKAGVNRQLIVMATGLGKAVLFATLREHHGFQKKIMVLVHREELANQGADKIQRWNPSLMVGVEMANRRSSPMDNFIVASVPTLGRKNSPRIQKFNPAEFDAIVSDECHHCSGTQWQSVLDHFGIKKPNPDAPLSLGLTATPNRSDGQGLRSTFDEIVYDMGIREGIESGYLVDLRGIRVATTANLDKVHTHAGDFAEAELSKEVNTDYRNGVIVKEWIANAYGKKTVVFTVDIQHALDLAEVFKKCCIEADAVWGDDPKRAEKLAKHRRGEITVLTNCAVLTEGYDDWGIECIVMAKPTRSALAYTQMCGRGTRIPDGVDNILTHEGVVSKTSCLLIDVVDNYTRNSLVTIPSLLGLPVNLDLKGKSVIKAKEQFERVAKEFPMANLSEITTLGKLDSIAENISLFHVKYPPEVSKLSDLGWRKSNDGYMLSVNRDSLITITKDLRDEWQIRGRIGERVIEEAAQNLPGAFNVADRMVLNNGGVKVLLARAAGWHYDSPSQAQLARCRKMGIEVPVGATKGDVSRAIDAKYHQGSTR